jgi:hypothetical protein
MAASKGWHGPLWQDFALFNGTVATLMMIFAVGLTLYSLYIYLHDYGYLLRTRPAGAASGGDRSGR